MDELVSLLGLDIPPVPEVSLAGITAEGVLLYWKPPESHHTSLTHAIHVNGIKGLPRIIHTRESGNDKLLLQSANLVAAIHPFK